MTGLGFSGAHARSWGLAALALALLAALMLRAPEPRDSRTTLYVFGTLVEIMIQGEGPRSAQAAMAAGATLLNRLHHDWHAWRPGALGEVNGALAAGRAHPVTPELEALLAQGQRLSCASGGLFDPAIGGLVRLWGFHSDSRPQGPGPDPAALAAWRAAAPSMADVTIAHGRVASRNGAVQFDLGAYAKGAALDLLAAEFRARGIENAVLNAGGDVSVLGQHGARPWAVAIRDPFAWGAVGRIGLAPGEVLYTSGNYERFLENDGVRFSHILDPRSARPVAEIVSASVLGRNGAQADAAATALSVAGQEGWAQIAADMGVEAALLITQSGEMLMTPAMAARFEPMGEPWPHRIVPLPVPAAKDCVPNPLSEIRQTG